MYKPPRFIRITGLVLGLVSSTYVPAHAQRPAATIESNVVYGMYSGLALLMEVHRPAHPNGYGIVYIAGSGFTSPMAYDAAPLTQSPQIDLYGTPLLAAGYTVFALNHRAAPRFRFPAPIEDVQRAVRFIRHHAGRFGIRHDLIGAAGGSSGGYLALMLGVMDRTGDPGDPDPVNQQSAKVQTVVVRAAPSDFLKVTGGGPAVIGFLGMVLPPGPTTPDPASVEYRTLRDASPVHYVGSGDPPTLLMHGDADEIVPIRHSELLDSAYTLAGVPARLLRISGGRHGPTFAGAPNPPDFLGEMVRWFDQHLKGPIGKRVEAQVLDVKLQEGAECEATERT